MRGVSNKATSDIIGNTFLPTPPPPGGDFSEAIYKESSVKFMAEILGLGGVCIDRLVRIAEMPAWDETQFISAHATQQGGMVATAMVAVARLGGNAEFIGGLGADDAGHFALQTFQEARVKADRIKIFPGETTAFSFCLVQETTGSRALLHYPGVQAKAGLNLPAIDLTGVRFLHFDGYWFETALQIAPQAKAQGITLTLDPCPQMLQNPQAEALFRCVDYFIPSYAFAAQLTGETDPFRAAARILQYGAQAVIVTKGEEGCFITTAAERQHLPAFEVPVVDTTGAGDVFHGAFLSGLQRGYALRQAAQFASAVAALKCTKLGGQTGIPTFQETGAFLQARGIWLS